MAGSDGAGHERVRKSLGMTSVEPYQDGSVAQPTLRVDRAETLDERGQDVLRMLELALVGSSTRGASPTSKRPRIRLRRTGSSPR